MKRDLLADLAICEAATPGPWESKTNRHPEIGGSPWGWYEARGCRIGVWSGSSNRNFSTDNRFIVTAREGWPEAIRRAIAAEAEAKRLRTELKVESLRAAEWEGAALGCAEMWRKLREVVVTNATGGGGENINDYDIMLNVMDDIESGVSEDGAA